MTQTEALKLALEALKTIDEAMPFPVAKLAIKECKAALEAKDEPVSQPKVRTGNCLRVGVCASEGHKIQPQRTWVGLTEDEQRNIAYSDINCWDWGELMDAVEAKLKEKNG